MVKYLNNASHEARTLMTGILGVTQVMLNSQNVSTDTRENLEIIIENSYSLLVLFEDVINTMQEKMKQVA